VLRNLRCHGGVMIARSLRWLARNLPEVEALQLLVNHNNVNRLIFPRV
jgi:hypothetical protein